ncbi:MAG: branched-chain amino acid ABC transporter permease [Gammaproteobacteria bacterium]|nr:branched-chain amino acid ABC transporter permease [Gammaproteobacteria bacterium]
MPVASRKWVPLAVLAVFLAALPGIAEMLGDRYLVSLFSRLLIYALVAVSLDLILGYGGMVSFGHAAFFGVGAYTVAILSFHGFEGTPFLEWPLRIEGSTNALVTLPAAALCAAIFALIIGSLSLRTTGMHFIMITLAFAQMLYFLYISLERYGGDDGLSLYSRNDLPGLDLSDDGNFYYLCLGVLSISLFLGERLINSRFGQVIQGIRENERRMLALGFPVYRYRLACFVIAGGIAGLGGGLIANQTEFVSPGLMHWTQSGEILVMVLLGGMGTLFGPLLGALVFLLMEEILTGITEHWMVIMGPFLIGVVLYTRGGIYGLITGQEKAGG